MQRGSATVDWGFATANVEGVSLFNRGDVVGQLAAAMIE